MTNKLDKETEERFDIKWELPQFRLNKENVKWHLADELARKELEVEKELSKIFDIQLEEALLRRRGGGGHTNN